MNLKLVSLVALVGSFGFACGDSGTDTATGGNTPTGGNNSEGGGGSTGVLAGPGGGNPVGAGGPGGGAEPGTGVCETDLEFDGDVIDGCLSTNCCASFDPCLADADCTDCLESGPTGAGCDTNALYQPFQTCFATSCPGLICDSTLGTPSPLLNACIQDNCCATFSPCAADTTCTDCLSDDTIVGCDTNALYTPYLTCRDGSCPQDICGTGIIFGITYPNGSQDTAYDSNLCAQDNCCAQLTACADPEGDGFLPMNDPGTTACLLCLQNDPACSSAIEPDATAFSACIEAECPM